MQWHAITVNTSNELRVKINFQEFRFSKFGEYLEIGDGLIMDNDTRLVRFSGSDLPTHVTSVSSGAWINVKAVCGDQSPTLKFTVTAVHVSGKICILRNSAVVRQYL